MKKFNEYLRNQRKMQNMSVYRLSKLSGVAVGTIHHYEKDGVIPPVDKADRLLAALGITLTLGVKASVPNPKAGRENEELVSRLCEYDVPLPSRGSQAVGGEE